MRALTIDIHIDFEGTDPTETVYRELRNALRLVSKSVLEQHPNWWEARGYGHEVRSGDACGHFKIRSKDI